MKSVFVTGAAGFIGFHTATRLLKNGVKVVGIDNLNDYYDVNLKHARLEQLSAYPKFEFIKMDLSDRFHVHELFEDKTPTIVVHLAAQAGVRYSLINPHAYVDSNLSGFLNILEGCRAQSVKHLVFASSSSVYGANTKIPFDESDVVDHPVSLYAATKKANELMAHSYSHLYGLPVTGLRFFTVYGPWGRPDMAYFKFTDAIYKGNPIQVFNNGYMRRDFTYIDDVVEGVVRVMDSPPVGDKAWSSDYPSVSSSYAPYRIYNIGNHRSVPLKSMIRLLEKYIGRKAIIDFQPMQPGDVYATHADVKRLKEAVGFSPFTSLDDGLERFVGWYRKYYKF